MSKQQSYSSKLILDLLAARHSKDVFISECKDGPTQSGSHVRMDAWVMNKSWAHPAVTAYEVKVSRADFLKDNKWPAYLPLCNQFYFVAPAGLIDPSELPPEAGLMTAAGKGGGARLLTKKKAPHRDVAIPENVYRYILMCRVTTTPESSWEKTDNGEYWRRWLAEKAEKQTLGWRVSQRVAQKAGEIETENVRLQREIQKYAELQQWLSDQGLHIHDWQLQQKLADRLRAHQTLFDSEFLDAIRDARNRIDSALTIARGIEAQANQENEPIKKTA